MARIRADWTLEQQLILARQQSRADEVRSAIGDAIEWMNSGRSRNKRGGRHLVTLLEVARLRASEESEWDVVRLVHDSIEYSEGRILTPEFEDRYRLFRDSKLRSEINTNFLARMLGNNRAFVRGLGQQFLADNPNALGQELLDHLDGVIADSAYLEAPEDEPGIYRVTRGVAQMALWVERVLRERVEVVDPHAEARDILGSTDVVSALLDSDRGKTVLRAAELKRRATELGVLRRAVEDPVALEATLQELVSNNLWIFGGEFLPSTAARRLLPGDEYDIPLVRGDGCLHVVELKQAMAAGPIVKRHRNAWVPTAVVHDAAAQAINYLVGLDENRKMIKDQLNIEVRRASATVVVGHPHRQGAAEAEINETLRTLSSHLGRVEVMTYKELVDGAERALDLA